MLEIMWLMRLVLLIADTRNCLVAYAARSQIMRLMRLVPLIAVIKKLCGLCGLLY
jgi:hypothetical protein